jgi:hypothetical protein
MPKPDYTVTSTCKLCGAENFKKTFISPLRTVRHETDWCSCYPEPEVVVKWSFPVFSDSTARWKLPTTNWGKKPREASVL